MDRWKINDCICLSEVLRLITKRLSSLHYVAGKIGLWKNKSSLESQKFSSALVASLLLWLVDLIIGIAFTSWIMDNNEELCRHVLASCLELLRSGVFSLTGILDWLMDNPAGLKLNKELADTLGAFFTHHISLWQMYINYLTNFLEGGYTVMFMCSFGFLGLSFHAALLVDLISLFTVHVQCFYIYMARLYNFQLRGLLALSRFFRGKKWNPLRQRVDHTESSVDQLFVGSLIMMVFVFLLPTTFTFYAVFALLHVFVKFAQLLPVSLSRWMELFVKLPDAWDLEVQKPAYTHSLLFAQSCRKIILGEIL